MGNSRVKWKRLFLSKFRRKSSSELSLSLTSMDAFACLFIFHPPLPLSLSSCCFKSQNENSQFNCAVAWNLDHILTTLRLSWLTNNTGNARWDKLATFAFSYQFKVTFCGVITIIKLLSKQLGIDGKKLYKRNDTLLIRYFLISVWTAKFEMFDFFLLRTLRTIHSARMLAYCECVKCQQNVCLFISRLPELLSPLRCWFFCLLFDRFRFFRRSNIYYSLAVGSRLPLIVRLKSFSLSTPLQ